MKTRVEIPRTKLKNILGGASFFELFFCGPGYGDLSCPTGLCCSGQGVCSNVSEACTAPATSYAECGCQPAYGYCEFLCFN